MSLVTTIHSFIRNEAVVHGFGYLYESYQLLHVHRGITPILKPMKMVLRALTQVVIVKNENDFSTNCKIQNEDVDE